MISRQRIACSKLSRRAGFTLVELMIVLLLLAVLAALVIPQFTSAADQSRESAVKMDLHRIRTQLEIYRSQHNGAFPALATFREQMTQASNAAGQTADLGTAGYKLGPYIREVPTNPHTGTNDVSDGEVGSSAWYYNESTGEFRANNSERSSAF